MVVHLRHACSGMFTAPETPFELVFVFRVYQPLYFPSSCIILCGESGPVRTWKQKRYIRVARTLSSRSHSTARSCMEAMLALELPAVRYLLPGIVYVVCSVQSRHWWYRSNQLGGILSVQVE